MKKTFLVGLLICLYSSLYSQDIGELTKSEMFSVSGSAGAIGTFYNVSGIEARRDPFFWQFNASLNVKAVGVNIPITLRLTQQERSFTQPFNQYGLSPKYKAFTVHIGYRSMKLSEFSLSSNQFLGVGVEIAPEKSWVSGKILYGRFVRAVDGYYQDGTVIGSPSYERWGGGARVSVGKKNNNVGLVFFKAKDDPNSLSNFADDATIRPGDNIIWGITTKQKLSKSLTLDAEIDWSAFTNDTRVPESVLEGYSYINNLGSLFYANTTSTFNKALYANLKYSLKKLRFKLAYRRVDPQYRSMGSVYLNNDFEDVSLNSSYKFFSNKLTVNGAIGLQRNNLAKDKMSGVTRVISSVSVNYTPNQNWNFAGSFSNFNSTTEMTLITSFDTLRYAQVSKNAGMQAMYNVVKNKNKISVFLGSNYQVAKINGVTNAEFYNATLGCQYGLTKISTNITLSLSANQNNTELVKASAIGPVLGVSKSILKKKISISVSSTVLNSYTNGENVGLVYNLKAKTKYKINKKHVINLGYSFAKREDPSRAYSESIATIGYNYIFSK